MLILFQLNKNENLFILNKWQKYTHHHYIYIIVTASHKVFDIHDAV